MVELLLNEGYHVVVIDDMSNGQLDNIKIFENNPNYDFKKIDISTDFDHRIFKNTKYVFHLAALADIVPSIENPLKYYRSNVSGTINVLEACRKYSVEKIVYSASSSCYGIPDIYPTPETAEPRPQYPYALTKYLGEEIFMHWNKIYGIPIISLRYFNVFGTRARTNNTYGAVFKVFLKQKLEKHPLTIVGDGTQRRDFIYVTDVVRANLIAAESDVDGEIFNVGTGKPQSISYLAELIGGDVVNIPKRPAEPEITHADITKIIKMLKWKPEISFEEGIKIMLENIDYWKTAPLFTVKTIENATKNWFKYLSK
jgi:UDP-glucose 4-epimerase